MRYDERMTINKSVKDRFSVLAVIIAAAMTVFGFAAFSYAGQIGPSGSRSDSTRICANGAFCRFEVFNDVATSSPQRGTVTLNCPSAFVTDAFDTPDGFLDVGDYYFDSVQDKYVAFVAATNLKSATSTVPICEGPQIVTSDTKPNGLKLVNKINTVAWETCDLEGTQVLVKIPYSEYQSFATASGILSAQINPRISVGCIYPGTI